MNRNTESEMLEVKYDEHGFLDSDWLSSFLHSKVASMNDTNKSLNQYENKNEANIVCEKDSKSTFSLADKEGEIEDTNVVQVNDKRFISISEKLSTLSTIRHDIHLLRLASQYHHFITSTSNLSVHSLKSDDDTIPHHMQRLKHLALILLNNNNFELQNHRHTHNQDISNQNTNSICMDSDNHIRNSNTQYNNIYSKIFQQYQSIHQHIISKCILTLRKLIRKYDYPSECGCALIADDFQIFWNTFQTNSTSTTTTSTDDDDDDDNNGEMKISEILKQIQASIQSCSSSPFASYACFLIHAETIHQIVLKHIPTQLRDLNPSQLSNIFHPNRNPHDLLLQEMIRPIVQRTRFHFLQDCKDDISPNSLVYNSTDDEKNSHSTREASSITRLSSSRIDRLPEWMLMYIRTTLENNGVWHTVVLSCLIPLIQLVNREMDNLLLSTAPFLNQFNSQITNRFNENERQSSYSVTTLDMQNFLNLFLKEIISLIQHILHTRNFFRHPSIVGHSNPNIQTSSLPLSHAIEQFLRFDYFLNNLVSSSIPEIASYEENEVNTTSITPNVPSVMNSIICADDALFQWWISTEKEKYKTVLLSSLEAEKATLEHDDSVSHINLLSPVSETFLSILFSVNIKVTSLLNNEHKAAFIRAVIYNLCEMYMDIMHQYASSLREKLLSKQDGKKIPSDDQLRQNCLKWLRVITGIRAVVNTLRHYGNDVGIPSIGNEVSRISVSLENLSNAMVEEYSSLLVENLLMEKTKLASYLIRCAYTLSHGPDYAYPEKRLSPELNDTARILSIVSRACLDSILYSNNDLNHRGEKACKVMNEAPIVIMENIIRRMEEKFCEGLSYIDEIDEVNQVGANVFLHDVLSIKDILCHEDVFLNPNRESEPFSDVMNILTTRMRIMEST